MHLGMSVSSNEVVYNFGVCLLMIIVYAFGCLCQISLLLLGFLPFDDDNTQRLYRLIQRGTYEIPIWLSSDSQKIIGALLKHKPDSRISMPELLKVCLSVSSV